MTSKTVLAACLGIALGIAAPAIGAEERPADVRRLENRIRQTLVDRLGEDARTVQVAINGKKAFLSGTVDERVTQELAKEVVLSFDEIASATNRIEARKAARLAEGQAFLEGQDAELEIRVRRAVSKALGSYAKSIQVEVVDGVVSMRGTLPDLDRKVLAMATARSAGKVRDILDLIRTAR